MASKNQRKTAKSAASKSYIDQMNELSVSEGVKRQAKQYMSGAMFLSEWVILNNFIATITQILYL